MTRLIDFDAFRAEQHDEPLKVKVGGIEYELPSSPPADISLDILRRMHDQQGDKIDLPARDVPDLAEKLFGREMLDELVGRHRLALSELGALIQQVMAAYQEDAAPPPNRKTRREHNRRKPSTSSKGGRASRRTSSASTGSTSATL